MYTALQPLPYLSNKSSFHSRSCKSLHRPYYIPTYLPMLSKIFCTISLIISYSEYLITIDSGKCRDSKWQMLNLFYYRQGGANAFLARHFNECPRVKLDRFEKSFSNNQNLLMMERGRVDWSIIRSNFRPFKKAALLRTPLKATFELIGRGVWSACTPSNPTSRVLIQPSGSFVVPKLRKLEKRGISAL